MGKDITTAMGTEMQYMPQPDKDYTERLNSVEGAKGSTASGASDSALMANNLNDLNGSWLNFINSHDERWETYTMSKAQAMINGASDADIKNLNAIDLAQTYGYGTLADNGYFKAFSSKLRGQRLADMAKAAYADKYGDDPLPVDKDESRYTQFMGNFRTNLNMENWGENNVAFQEGFNNNNAQNAIDLANNAAQRDVADRKDTTAKEITSQLSQYGANGMLKDKPEVAAQKVTQLCNQMKLGGLDPATRTDIMDKFCQEVMSRGIIRNPADWYKFEKGVMVQTNLDGTQTSLFDLRDRLADSGAISNYRKAHDINFKKDLTHTYGHDPRPDRYDADTQKLYNSGSLEDRDKADMMVALRSSIFATQGRANAGRTKGKPLGASKSDLASAMNQAKHDLVIDNIHAYMSNGASETDEHGSFIGKVKLANGKGASENDYYNGFCQVRDEIENNTDLSTEDKNKQIMRLYEYAGMSPIKNTVMTQLCNTAQQMSRDDVENNGIEPWLIRADEARRSDPVSFRNAYGEKFDDIITQIQSLEPSEESDPMNRLTKGYEKYLDAHHVDKQTYEDNMKKCASETKAMNIEDGVGLDGSEDNVIDVNDPQISEKFRNSCVLYMNSGMDANTAYQYAMRDIQSSYTYYHHAYVPDCYLSDSGVDDLKHNSSIAFDLLAEQYGGWDSGVTMKYNPYTQTMDFTDAEGNLHPLSQNAIMNEIRAVPYMEQKLAEEEAKRKQNAQQAYTYHRAENEGKGEGLSNNPIDTNSKGYSSFDSLKNVPDADNTAGGKYVY